MPLCHFTYVKCLDKLRCPGQGDCILVGNCHDDKLHDRLQRVLEAVHRSSFGLDNVNTSCSLSDESTANAYLALASL